jgi:hypothetical protein
MLKPPIPVSMTALPGAANFITVTPSIVILFDRLALHVITGFNRLPLHVDSC